MQDFGKEEEMMNRIAVLSMLLFLSAGLLFGCSAGEGEKRISKSDQELARLLVKLEPCTRATIAKHYVDADEEHRAWLSRNLLLPAAVADSIFHGVVPETTGERAWVKMVVDDPRNPHNAGDEIALALLDEVRGGKQNSERSTDNAFYYAEPIKAAPTCLACHGGPEGEPDPFFPQYRKNGWEAGQIVGAVVARVGEAE